MPEGGDEREGGGAMPPHELDFRSQESTMLVDFATQDSTLAVEPPEPESESEVSGSEPKRTRTEAGE